MPEDESEERYHWIVVFRKGGKPYTYMFRTIEEMAATMKSHRARKGDYPYRTWVVVDDEIQKVIVT